MNSEKWVGITASGESVTFVILEFRDEHEMPLVMEDFTWSLQQGEKPSSYQIMYDRIRHYFRESDIKFAAIKESAASTKMSLSHLYAAELRGVVMAAVSAAQVEVKTVKKSTISRTFGQRNVDEYISDDMFWESSIEGRPLRKGSRETALVVISAKKR